MASRSRSRSRSPRSAYSGAMSHPIATLSTRAHTRGHQYQFLQRAQFSIPRPGGRVVRPLLDRRIKPTSSSVRGRRIFAFSLSGIRMNPRAIDCLRRTVRSRVLHALGVAGRRGVGRGRPRRLSENSHISC